MQEERRNNDDPDGNSTGGQMNYKGNRTHVYSVIPDAPKMRTEYTNKGRSKSVNGEPTISQVWDLTPPPQDSNNVGTSEERVQLQRQAQQAYIYVQQQEWRRQNGIFKMIIGPTITTPRIKVTINEAATVAYWDTGAPISLIHRKLLTPRQLTLVRPMTEDYYSFTGQKLDINEKIRIVFLYQEQHICAQVCITDHEVIQCVLGMDIIAQLERRQVDWMNSDKAGEMRIAQPSRVTKEGQSQEVNDEGNRMEERRRMRIRNGLLYEESAETTVIRPHQMPLIRQKVEINGNAMEGIMDTGCVITAIALRKLSSFQKWSMVPTNRRFRAITGKEVLISGTWKVDLNILGYVTTRIVYVFMDCAVDCIIGLDVIQELENKGIKWLKSPTEKEGMVDGDLMMPLFEISDSAEEQERKDIFDLLPLNTEEDNPEQTRERQFKWSQKKEKQNNGLRKRDRILYWEMAKIQGRKGQYSNKRSFDTRTRIGRINCRKTINQAIKARYEEYRKKDPEMGISNSSIQTIGWNQTPRRLYQPRSDRPICSCPGSDYAIEVYDPTEREESCEPSNMKKTQIQGMSQTGLTMVTSKQNNWKNATDNGTETYVIGKG